MNLFSELKNQSKEHYAYCNKKIENRKETTVLVEKFIDLWGEKNGRRIQVKLDHWGEINVEIWLGKGDSIKDIHIAFDETIWKEELEYKYIISRGNLQYYATDIEIRIYARPDSNCEFITRKTGVLIPETETIIKCL
jgi:hypothetical protein